MGNKFYKEEGTLLKSEFQKTGFDFSKIKFQKLNEINLKFKKNSFYFLLAPLFLIIAFYVYLKKKIIPHPKINFYFFDGLSKNCREIKENAARWRSLDIIYNKRPENVFEKFWSFLITFQSTKNRLKLVKFLLLKNIEEISKNNKETRLISIASGSAQGVIETINEAKQKGILVRAMLIDLDQTALEHAKQMAQKLGVENQITLVNKTASSVLEIGKEFRPNLIELVGFLEYRPLDKAVKLINNIYNALEYGGVFLVSQIAPNVESFFLKEVVNWPMIYRKPKELAKILSLTNFSLEHCLFYFEPLKIHYIIECKKL